MSVVITGIRELDAKLEKMKRSVQTKVIKKAMTQGTKEMAKAIKRRIPSTWKGAKKTIGHRVNRPGRGRFKGVMFAKAGAGVGMSKKRRTTMFAKAKAKGRGQRKGVGIGVSNIMWFLEGTEERQAGTKRVGARRRGVTNKRGDTGGVKRRTGKLRRSGIVQAAFGSTSHLAKQLVMAELKAGIMREATKR